MVFVFGFFAAIFFIVIITGAFLLSDMEGSILKIIKKQIRKMDDKIYRVKDELEEVKMTERVDILHEILDTIDDYEAIKLLEANKEKAKASKENADLRHVGLELKNNDDPIQRKELKKLGQEIVDIDPITHIDLEYEREKRKEITETFQLNRECST